MSSLFSLLPVSPLIEKKKKKLLFPANINNTLKNKIKHHQSHNYHVMSLVKRPRLDQDDSLKSHNSLIKAVSWHNFILFLDFFILF